jgi:hypothetical protein
MSRLMDSRTTQPICFLLLGLLLLSCSYIDRPIPSVGRLTLELGASDTVAPAGV